MPTCRSTLSRKAEGPLAAAERNIAEEGLSHCITVRLSDGLEKITIGEARCAVIAGMGGALTVRILERSMETVRALRELVLAPQSELPLVRRFLYRNGFAICEEKMVFEDGKYYPVMKVKPPGIDNAFLKDTEEGIGQRLGILFGPCLLRERDPVLEQYLLKQKKICERNIRQITEHGSN